MILLERRKLMARDMRQRTVRLLKRLHSYRLTNRKYEIEYGWRIADSETFVTNTLIGSWSLLAGMESLGALFESEQPPRSWSYTYRYITRLEGFPRVYFRIKYN